MFQIIQGKDNSDRKNENSAKNTPGVDYAQMMKGYLQASQLGAPAQMKEVKSTNTIQNKGGLDINTEKSLENEADEMGRNVAENKHANIKSFHNNTLEKVSTANTNTPVSQLSQSKNKAEDKIPDGRKNYLEPMFNEKGEVLIRMGRKTDINSLKAFFSESDFKLSEDDYKMMIKEGNENGVINLTKYDETIKNGDKTSEGLFGGYIANITKAYKLAVEDDQRVCYDYAINLALQLPVEGNEFPNEFCKETVERKIEDEFKEYQLTTGSGNLKLAKSVLRYHDENNKNCDNKGRPIHYTVYFGKNKKGTVFLITKNATDPGLKMWSKKQVEDKYGEAKWGSNPMSTEKK